MNKNLKLWIYEFLLKTLFFESIRKFLETFYDLILTQFIFQESAESAEAKYDFDWSVKDEYSGNDFGQQESRDGDKTQGSYYVQLPDGRLQKVTYYVDGDSGFVADVSYEGEARYPDSHESKEAYGRK